MTFNLTTNTTEQDNGNWQPNNVDLPTDVASADGILLFPDPGTTGDCVLGLTTVAMPAGFRAAEITVEGDVDTLQGADIEVLITHNLGTPVEGGESQILVSNSTAGAVGPISGTLVFNVAVNQTALDTLCVRLIGRATMGAGGVISGFKNLTIGIAAKRDVVYVEESWNGGSDANPGTQALPKLTVVGAMADVANNGILIFGVGTFSGEIAIPDNGSIEVRGQGVDRTEIVTDPGAYTGGGGLIWGNAVNLTVKDLTLNQNVADEYYCINPNNNTNGDTVHRIEVRRVRFKYRGAGGFNAAWYGQTLGTSVVIDRCLVDSSMNGIFVEDGYLFDITRNHFKGTSALILNGHDCCATVQGNSMILTRQGNPGWADPLMFAQFAGQSATFIDNTIASNSIGADNGANYTIFSISVAGPDHVNCTIDRNTIAVKPNAGVTKHIDVVGDCRVAVGRQQWLDPVKISNAGGTIVMADELTPILPARPSITKQRADNLDKLDTPVSSAGGGDETQYIAEESVTISDT